MSNGYFTPSSNPVTQSRGSSAAVRGEFVALEAAFDKLPTKAQLWGGGQNYVAASGAADTWTATLASTYLTSYVDGMTVRVKFADANTSTTPTLNLNALGAKTIVSEAGAALNAGDIPTGTIAELTYNATSGKWQIRLGNNVASSAANAAAAATSASAASTSAQAAADSESAAAASEAAAGDSETAAAASAAAAALSDAQAQAYADAAAASGHVYDTSADGVAGGTGVAAGQYYLVKSASTDSVFDLWKNVGGVATDQGKSFPSATLVTGVLGRDTSITNAQLVGHDTAGDRFMEIDDEGAAAHTDVLIGNARSAAELATTVDANETLLQTWQTRMARSIDKAFGNAQPSFSAGAATIFSTATDGNAAWRLPVICRISATQYLVFANSQSGSGDFTQMTIYYKLVTVNPTTGAITLGALTTLTGAEGGPDDGTGKAFQYQLGSVIRTSTGRIVVYCTYRNVDALVHVPYRFVSDDAAAAAIAATPATWTKTDVSASFPALGVTWNAIIFGPAKGIQLQRGDYAGRIIFPYWRSGTGYPGTGGNDLWAGFLFSDDNCDSENLGAESWLSRANESAVAEDIYGRVLLFSRREAKAGKWVHRSEDGGAHIHDVWQLDQTSVNAPVVECGVTNTDNSFDHSTAKIALTTPRPTTAASNTTGLGRDHLTVMVSYDGGVTFPYQYQVSTGACLYTAVEACGEAGLLVLSENSSSNLTIAGQVISINNPLTGA